MLEDRIVEAAVRWRKAVQAVSKAENAPGIKGDDLFIPDLHNANYATWERACSAEMDTRHELDRLLDLQLAEGEKGEQSRQAEMLAIFLDATVPLRIAEIRGRGENWSGRPNDFDIERARACGFVIAEGRDDNGADATASLLDAYHRRSKENRKGVALLMSEIAFALAVGAFCPGGVPDFLGRHWEVGTEDA